MENTPIQKTARVKTTVTSPVLRTNFLQSENNENVSNSPPNSPSPSPSATLVAWVPTNFLEIKKEPGISTNIVNPIDLNKNEQIDKLKTKKRLERN